MSLLEFLIGLMLISLTFLELLVFEHRIMIQTDSLSSDLFTHIKIQNKYEELNHKERVDFRSKDEVIHR